jgi:hypothetical protein
VLEDRFVRVTVAKSKALAENSLCFLETARGFHKKDWETICRDPLTWIQVKHSSRVPPCWCATAICFHKRFGNQIVDRGGDPVLLLQEHGHVLVVRMEEVEDGGDGAVERGSKWIQLGAIAEGRDPLQIQRDESIDDGLEDIR